MKHQQPSELISFLENQNTSFRQENKCLKELLSLNREALKIALAPRNQQQTLPHLVSLLFEENSKLLSRCNVLQSDLESKSCQALISEQIASASNDHEKYVAGQLKDRLKLLKKDLDAKEKRISELIKQTGTRERREEGDADEECTIVQYTDMTKISEKLFKEAESLRREIVFRDQDISKLREQKQELVKLNLILTKQVNELKAYSCQSTNSQKRDFNSSPTDLSKFLKYQSKIAQHSDDESDDDRMDSSDMENSSNEDEQYSEDKEVNQTMKLQLKLPQKVISDKVEKSICQQKNSSLVPKLELKKAKEIQNLIVKKINNDEKKKQGTSKDQKMKKFQAELDQLRKKLGNQIIVKLRYERENNFLKKFINELEQRNKLLLSQKQDVTIEKNYKKQRQNNRQENVESLLDICRDVTLNERLRAVCKGNQGLHHKKDMYSKEI